MGNRESGYGRARGCMTGAWLAAGLSALLGCGGTAGVVEANGTDPMAADVAVDSGADTDADRASAADAGADTHPLVAPIDSGAQRQDKDADMTEDNGDAGGDAATVAPCVPVDQATACQQRCGSKTGASDGCGAVYSCAPLTVCSCASGAPCCTFGGGCGCAIGGSCL